MVILPVAISSVKNDEDFKLDNGKGVQSKVQPIWGFYFGADLSYVNLIPNHNGVVLLKNKNA